MPDLTSFLTTLLSVLVGAGTTYTVQQLLEHAKANRCSVAAIRSAQLILSSQYNFAARASKTLAPYENADDRHAKIVKHYMSSTEVDIQMNDLAFLVQKNEGQAFIEIAMAIESVKLLRQLIDEHHKAYDDLFSTAKNYSIELGPTKIAGEFEEIKVLRLKSLVDLLYTQSKDAEIRTKKCISELFRIGKSHFPGNKFIKLQ